MNDITQRENRRDNEHDHILGQNEDNDSARHVQVSPTYKMKSFHDYASLKTTGQLVMDLGSISTHICALVALLRQYDVNKNLSTQVLLWVLVGTIIFQIMVAVGLYIFRTLDLNDEINHRVANRWNIAFFVSLFLIACLETFIGAYEKFGLDHTPMANGSHVTTPNEPF